MALKQLEPPSPISARTAEGIRDRLIRGFGATALGPLTSLLVQVISVPLFLRFWGARMYGEWLVLIAIPFYLGLFDVGLANVAGNEMTMCTARGDRAGALVTFQSTWAFITAVSLVIAVPVFACIWLLPIAALLKLTAVDQTSARWVLSFLAAEVLIDLQSSVLTSGFRCDGRYALGTLWLNSIRLAEYGFGTALLFFGANPVQVAASFLVARLIGTLRLIWLLKTRIPWLEFGYEMATLSCIRRLSAPAIAYLAFPAASAVSVQGILIVVSLVLGPIAVVVFSTLRTLTRLALQFVGTINNTVWPEFSTAYGANDLKLARKLHRYSCRASFWLSSAIAIVLLLFGRLIFHLWLHDQVQMDYKLFALLVLAVLANCLWWTSSVASVACNSHHRIATFYFGGTCASVLLAYALLPHVGLAGAALAVLSTELAMIWMVIRSSLRILNESTSDFLAEILSGMAIVRTLSGKAGTLKGLTSL